MAVAAMAAATATGCLRWGLSQTQTQIPNRSRSPGPLIALACHLDHRLCQGLLERAVAAQARSPRNKWPLPSRHWPSRALPRSPTVRAGRVSVVACRAYRGATKPRLYWPQGLCLQGSRYSNNSASSRRRNPWVLKRNILACFIRVVGGTSHLVGGPLGIAMVAREVRSLNVFALMAFSKQPIKAHTRHSYH